MNNRKLTKLIQEAVAAALQEFDRGDIDLQRSSNADQLVRQADQHIDALRALTQTLYRGRNSVNLQILKAMNTSLDGFVQKVTTAVRTGKM